MGKSLSVVNCIIHEMKNDYHIVIYQKPIFYLANLHIVFFSASKTQNFAQFLKCFMLIFDKALSKHLPDVRDDDKSSFVKFCHNLPQCDDLFF